MTGGAEARLVRDSDLVDVPVAVAGTSIAAKQGASVKRLMLADSKEQMIDQRPTGETRINDQQYA